MAVTTVADAAVEPIQPYSATVERERLRAQTARTRTRSAIYVALALYAMVFGIQCGIAQLVSPDQALAVAVATAAGGIRSLAH